MSDSAEAIAAVSSAGQHQADWGRHDSGAPASTSGEQASTTQDGAAREPSSGATAIPGGYGYGRGESDDNDLDDSDTAGGYCLPPLPPRPTPDDQPAAGLAGRQTSSLGSVTARRGDY